MSGGGSEVRKGPAFVPGYGMRPVLNVTREEQRDVEAHAEAKANATPGWGRARRPATRPPSPAFADYARPLS